MSTSSGRWRRCWRGTDWADCRLGPEPVRAADLQVDGGVLRPARDVDARMQAELARELVSKADTASARRLVALGRALHRDTCLPDAAECDDAPAPVELPACFDLALDHLVAGIAHCRYAAQRDERPDEERCPVARLLVVGSRAE